MGCDIHSRAEIRIDGEWQMLPAIFPETYSTRWVTPTRPYLESLTDVELYDAVDYYIHRRVKKSAGYEKALEKALPEIDPTLAQKIFFFAEAMSEKIEWARDKKITTDDDGEYDPDAWTRWVRIQRQEQIKDREPTGEEREQIIAAILNFRYHTKEEWVEMGNAIEDYDTDENNILTIHETRTEEDDIDWFKLEPLGGRHYDLFAQLAGVRNYHEIEPISQPKGSGHFEMQDKWVLVSGKICPDDASDEVRRFCERYGPDGHSHSWLSYQEFIDWGCHEVIAYKGWLTKKKFWRLLEKGYAWGGTIGPEPESYWYERTESDYEGTNAVYEVCWMDEKGHGRGVELKNMLRIFRELTEGAAVRGESLDRPHFKPTTKPTPDDLRVVFYFDN